MTRITRNANRSARLQLRANLDLASHAVELLHNKEEALQREQARLEGHAKRTEKQWQDHCREANTWLLRSRALGASSEIATIVDDAFRPAEVTIAWETAMGVTYPGKVHCAKAIAPTLTSTAALVPTATSYQEALAAGAEHAASTAALHRLETELSNTRRRRRAIEQRLQPRLETQLHQLDLDLDERDRDAAVRTHLATRHKSTQP